jgi:predicted Rossmann fold flavoprotein
MKLKKTFDCIIIGGGPAGMYAAIFAKKRGKSVCILEKNEIVGKKLLITGGGRCNVTNDEKDLKLFLENYKESKKFLFSTFTQHNAQDTLEFFHTRGVPTKVENLGRVFPQSNQAATICLCLSDEIKKLAIPIFYNEEVTHIHKKELFTITTKQNSYCSKALILACGGASHPETGSTGDGFIFAHSLGHSKNEISSSLVPIGTRDLWSHKISGVSLSTTKISLFGDNVKISTTFGKVLFTHTGLSGPGILNLSSSIGNLLDDKKSVRLEFDIMPDKNPESLEQELLEMLSNNSNKKIKNALELLLPKALIPGICEITTIDGNIFCHSLTKEARKVLLYTIKHLPLFPIYLFGAQKAVITRGGIPCEEVNFKTMESRQCSKLFLVGDMLDIDRSSGGFGLQLCWSTGFVAGNNV